VPGQARPLPPLGHLPPRPGPQLKTHIALSNLPSAFFQVIGIFAGFAILLLVASPLLLVAAPCLICCKCRACSKTDENTVKKVSSEIVAARNVVRTP